MQLTRKCHGCGESFRKDGMIEIFSQTGRTSQWYCPKCANEKHAREAFSNKVCEIFGIKVPGPRIWTERKRLMDTYGYTDSIIIDCLDYIYNVEHKKKLSESLCLINPEMIARMQAHGKIQERENNKIVAAINTKTNEYIVPIQKKKEKHPQDSWNSDDWLDDN